MMDEPGIMIDSVWMVWCPKHLEPYRAEWPIGYAPAMFCLVNQALNDKEIIDASGGDVSRLNAVLREYGPLCCRYPEILDELAESFIQNEDKERWRTTLRKYGSPPPGGWKENTMPTLDATYNSQSMYIVLTGDGYKIEPVTLHYISPAGVVYPYACGVWTNPDGFTAHLDSNYFPVDQGQTWESGTWKIQAYQQEEGKGKHVKLVLMAETTVEV